MKPGTTTTCPVCKRIHVFGARLGTPHDRQKFCSDKCEEIARASDQQAVQVLAQEGELQRFSRASLLVTVYCNSCVRDFQWSPAFDGNKCPRCGYDLSLYGPFEPKPSFASP